MSGDLHFHVRDWTKDPDLTGDTTGTSEAFMRHLRKEGIDCRLLTVRRSDGSHTAVLVDPFHGIRQTVVDWFPAGKPVMEELIEYLDKRGWEAV